MTAAKKTQAELLAEAFPSDQLKIHPGKRLTYVPISEVVARLNRILGVGKWSTKLLDMTEYGSKETQSGVYPKWLCADVCLSGFLEDGSGFSYDGTGGQEVQFLTSGAGPVDIGDNRKGAMSDAIKKAAQNLGVALNLAREEEAMQYEEALKTAGVPKADPATLDSIAAFVKALPEGDSKREEFKSFWNDMTGDGERGKRFDSGQVTLEEADLAVQFLGIKIQPPKKARSAKAVDEEAEPDGEPE